MQELKLPRLVIAATQSSSGKTTVVTGILRALKNMKVAVQPYKVGPDYIDPTYHGMAAGRCGHNLDSWLVTGEKMTELFAYEAKGADLAVVEGVMGLYDGGKNGISSTAEIAKALKAPVVLVINCRSMGDSAAAVALGFKHYDPEVNLAGVILNCLGSKTHYEMIAKAMAKLQIRVLGAVYRNDELKMPERHLGLTPAQEKNVEATVDKMAEAMADQIDIKALLEIAESAPALQVEELDLKEAQPRVKIAVARDKAFSFYYPASLQVLRSCGAELVFFSPLEDKELPPGVQGVILGGGFPELFAETLAGNTGMLNSLRAAAAAGMPFYGECGGFMYMMRGIRDFEGRLHPMLNIIPYEAGMHKKLQTVGYVEAKLMEDSFLGSKGTVFHGHEFHFSNQEEGQTENFAFEFTKMRNNAKYMAGYHKNNVLGSYLHMHFLGNPRAAENFVKACEEFKQKGEK